MRAALLLFALAVVGCRSYSDKLAEFRGHYLQGDFEGADLKHVARGVYRAQVTPPAHALDFEYYVRVVPADGGPVHFPPSAPKLNQTVVVLPDLPADK